MRIYTEQSTCTNCRYNSKNDQKFSGLLIMSPEDESKKTGSDKMYKIYEENPPWVVKKIRATDSYLPDKQMDWNGLQEEDYSSQDSFMSVSSEEIDSCDSDGSVTDNQDIINEKITQFLEWDTKELIQKQVNESNPGSFNPDQSQRRLLSGLDKNDQDPGDKTNDIEKTNSCHVYWNEYVECYRYPVESSVSTIFEVNTYPLKTDEIIRTRSQPNLSDDHNTQLNDTNKQQSNADGFWNGHTNQTNSYNQQTQTTHARPCFCEYHRYGDHTCSHSNKKDEQSDFSRSKKYARPCFCEYHRYGDHACSHSNKKDEQSDFSRSKKYTEWHKDDSNVNRMPYYHNNPGIPKPFLDSKNSFDSFVFKNADKMNNNKNSHQCSTSKKLSVEKHSIKDQKINQNKVENVKSDSMKNYSKNIKSKNDHDCCLCGHCHNITENIDDSKTSIKSRNKQLRKLLGLKPDEKNVLVMLKL